MSKLTLQDKTWVPGDTFRDAKVKPGLFVYSGFGLGYYFSVGGSIVWTTVDEASNMAREEGSVFDYFDPEFSFGGKRCDTR